MVKYNKKINKLLPFLPLATLCFTIIIVNLAYIGWIESPFILSIVSHTASHSLISLIYVYRMVYRNGFCFYSKLSFWGILIMVLINIINSIFVKIGIFFPYLLSFHLGSTVLVTTCLIHFIFKEVGHD